MPLVRYKRLKSDASEHLTWLRAHVPTYLLTKERFLIALVALSIFLLIVTCLLKPSIEQDTALKLQDQQDDDSMNYYYAVIVDCGSSGTRAHIYRWQLHDKNSMLVHDIEPARDFAGRKLSHKIEPGLSSVEDNPSEASVYMKPIMEFISLHIPEEKHQSTPIYFMATAGLRLLDKDSQSSILKDLKQDLSKQYGFPNVEAQVISGKEEGVYSWIAVNSKAKRFHLGDIPEEDAKKEWTLGTIGMLEMGGASAQVAFELRSGHELRQNKYATSPDLRRALDESKADIDLSFGRHEHKFRLFATTFLGAGSNSAREAAIDLLIRNMVNRGALSSAHPDLPIQLSDPCLPKNAVEKVKRPAEVAWSVGKLASEQTSSYRKNFPQTIGLKLDDDKPLVDVELKGSGSMLLCMAHLRKMLRVAKEERMNCEIDAPCSLSLLGLKNLLPFERQQFFGLSELYYTTNEMVSLAGPYRHDELKKATARICATHYSQLLLMYKDSNKKDKSRVLLECFKASWMMVFLVDGLGFPPKYGKLTNVGQIEGDEIDWTQGAVIEKAIELHRHHVRR